jgi:DNA-directed RNA polymerase specialized sigma24 family protein
MTMSEPTAFGCLIDRARAGEADAVAELVQGYEPALRRAMQVRLYRAALRHLLGPQDICQMVWADFFPRLAAGGYVVNEPAQLQRLLLTMARNRLVKEMARLGARRRGGHACRWSEVPEAWADPRPGPCQVAVGNDLLAKVFSLLSPAERQVIEHRERGGTWGELASTRGVTADALRVRHARTSRRIARRLCLEG